MIPKSVRLFAITYAVLALELTLIRWMSQQIRVFAYFTNLLIIAAFLGIGIGAALGQSSERLIRLTLPLTLALSALLTFSKRLDFMFLSFPDASITLWGADGLRADETFLVNVEIMLALFIVVAAIFATMGAELGSAFAAFPPLRAYSIDLLGSLTGVAAATLASTLRTPPPVWLAVALLPVAIVHSRTLVSWVSLAGVVVLAALSIDGALFSPYNRIDIARQKDSPTSYTLSANRDHHQVIIDLSEAAVARRPALRKVAALYELPFSISSSHDRALVVGAGTGNDVAAALRRGFRDVVAVEIDPVILDAGLRLHAERPYSSPRVRSVVSDARTFFEANRDARFDVVCFGLLDSHAMFSSMSTLRLDNYVYTVEALRKAFAETADRGVMTISFMVFGQQFMAARLSRNIHDATGQWPVIVRDPSGAYAFVVGKRLSRDEIIRRLPSGTRTIEFLSRIRPATDDWPFLYIRPATFPKGYVAVLLGVLAIAALLAWATYGRQAAGAFDGPLFLMGAAFLLLETRSITNLSLLFGSTWIVNAAVFAGVLMIAFLANAFVSRRPSAGPLVPALLFASLALNYVVTNTTLATMSLSSARIVGVATNVLPIGLAGVLFSALLRRSDQPAASLGSNLLGAVAGGVLEYASMSVGLRALALIAAALYAGAMLLGRRRLWPRGAAAAATLPSTLMASQQTDGV